MDSLIGYGSDDDNDNERSENQRFSVASSRAQDHRGREEDANYDDVNMDLSEESQAESEPELPPADPSPSNRHDSKYTRRRSGDSRDRSRPREVRNGGKSGSGGGGGRGRSSPERRDRRGSRRDEHRSERTDRSHTHDSGPRRGLLGDRPDHRPSDKMPPLLEAPSSSSQDTRDAVSPRFLERDRRDRDRDRERERDRHSRRSEEKRSGRDRERYSDRERERSKPRSTAYPPPSSHTSSGDRRSSPQSGDYRPSSYKVNRKLEVMEKMGLQIKTPDGSMATASQLRAASGPASASASSLPGYYNPSAVNANKILDQVQKRKLLWSNKKKSEAEEAAKWSGAKFSQDSDGKQTTKFMRLMGIKEPVSADNIDETADPVKKQEELFQAMQAQYEVARATTHTMRGVGLGFQRTPY